ncbi:hypothetical protein ACFE04_010137 [Oxalis oulophora]
MAMAMITLLFLTWVSLCFSYEPRNHEVEALMNIKHALNDPHGVLTNWDQDSVDPCSWTMITCSPDNLVVGLGAPSQSLSGSLSGSIGNLTNLKQVLMQNNNISGGIPLELSTLPKLETLDLSNNRFTGVIPNSLAQLTTLQYLRLNNNSLSGPFPVALAKTPQLAFLDLSYNNLSGPVPKFPARTFNIVGNPLICGGNSIQACSGTANNVPLSFPLNSASGKHKSKKLAIGLGVSLSFTSFIVLVVGLLWHRKRQNKQLILNINDIQEEGLLTLGNLKKFGTFGESQFRTELEMISLAVHRHLLRLIGYCASHNERLLVYPYMSNGSVASRLRAKPALDWNARKRIAIGAARGLLYLHEQCDPKIIHRDVKAANVLLDDFCEGVVGDFGLAKLLDHADSHVTTAVRGTVGHIAPEYLSTGQSSEKTDVFGFGILLIELITGMRALELGKTVNQKGAMLDSLKKVHQEKKFEALVDKALGSNYDRIEVGEMLQVALLCTQYLPAHRPKMSEVVRMLEGDGLAEKWASTHNQVNASMSLYHNNNNSSKSLLYPTTASKHGDSHDRSSMFGMDDEDDDHSLDSYAMELSGPR